MMDWKPIETAPKNGSEISLTWIDDGKPQEVYHGMRWSAFAGNPLVQSGKGIWVRLSPKTGKLIFTWSEEDPDGAPTHWAYREHVNMPKGE